MILQVLVFLLPRQITAQFPESTRFHTENWAKNRMTTLFSGIPVVFEFTREINEKGGKR